ncbi:MAG TPA: type III-A CRISPR-associated protein Csm2 [Syntrophales bacterium]|nr:type III-A CRISPR-associated protein Csm2 [Syntrophales bacterium]
MAKTEPVEERLSREWGLSTAEKIRDKIFERGDDCGLNLLMDAERLVVCSYALGKLLSSRDIGLKSSQLRRFYESIITIKAIVNTIRTKQNANELFKSRGLPEVVMLKPQLANAKARQSREVTPFFDVINPMLDCIKGIEDYEKLCQFVEAVVAYHKYCGGRD